MRDLDYYAALGLSREEIQVTSKGKIPPPRIHVILAYSQRVGVVFRRGPANHVASFLWDLNTDSFHIGQWLKGRIYEHRADISPDGKHMIYFARNAKWNSETGGTWTAVSKVPYLKALDLYAKGDTYDGGGLFQSNDSYWLNDRYFRIENTLKHSSGLTVQHGWDKEQKFGRKFTEVYYHRLVRDGWILTEKVEHQLVFEKPIQDGWIVRKLVRGGVELHELENSKSNTLLKRPEWDWSDVDQDQIVFSENGKIYRSKVDGPKSIVDPTMLHDFSIYSFEPLVAPY